MFYFVHYLSEFHLSDWMVCLFLMEIGYITMLSGSKENRKVISVFRTERWRSEWCKEKNINHSPWIWTIKNCFSSVNCSSEGKIDIYWTDIKPNADLPSLSLWKFCRKTKSFSLFLCRMFSICSGFLGFATKTWMIYTGGINESSD